MKKTIQFINLVLVTLLFTSSLTAQTLNFNWERSQAKGTLPTWFFTSAGLERGLAHSPVANHLYVISRTNPVSIYVLGATDGATVLVNELPKKLDVTGIAGGTFALNDIECDDDGVIFACNLSGTTETAAFKVYMWANEDAAPVNIISYTNATFPVNSRTGDQFLLTGKVSDNTAKIYAVSKVSTGGPAEANVVCWTTTDKGATWAPQHLFEITNTALIGVGANSANIFPIPGTTDFIYNENSKSPTRIDNTGAIVAAIPAAVTETNSNRVRVFHKDGKTYLLTFTYNQAGVSGTVTNYTKVVLADITNTSSPIYLGETSSLGTNKSSSAIGHGDMDLKDNGDGTYTVYVLGTDNGFGAVTIGAPMVSITSPVSGATLYGADATVSFKSIFGSAIADYSYTLDGSKEVSTTSPISLQGLSQNAHTVVVSMYEGANKVSTSEVTFTITIPTITITKPEEMELITTSSVNVEYTTYKAPTGATYKYILDAGTETASTASPIALTSLADGDHSVTINMYNGTTKVATKTVNFKVALPKVTITKPTENQVFDSKDVMVEFTSVSNPVDVNFTYVLDAAGEVAATSPISLTNLAEGAHAVTVKMYSAETFVTSHTVNFSVAIPKVALTNLVEGQIILSDDYDVTYTVENAPEGALYYYFLDAAQAVEVTSSPIKLVGISKGEHTFTFGMYKNGTKVTDKSVKFTRDYNTGIANELANSLRLYPNPATSVLNIEGENIKTIAINNLAGQTILTFEANNQQTVLDVQSLENGIYFVKVLTNQGNTHVQKFVKQ